MSKQSRHFCIVGIFIVINIALIGLNIFLIREKKKEIEKLLELRKSTKANQFYEYSQKESFNLDCPEIAGNSVEGNIIELRNYAGSVIIIQFSKFYREDLPNLVYLQDLADKYRKLGVFLLLIDTRGKHDSMGVGKFITLSYPVIEDDGTIRAQFNAYPSVLRSKLYQQRGILIS